MFQMIIEGERFVAKKLVDIGKGRGSVPLPEAVRLLSADLVRLKRMEYFAKGFFARGEQEGAELTCTFFLFVYTLHPLMTACSLPSLRWLSHQDLYK